MISNLPTYTDEEIVAARPEKAELDPWQPYAYHVEEERSAAGAVDPVATIFVTNRVRDESGVSVPVPNV